MKKYRKTAKFFATARAIPLIYTQSGKKLCRPSEIFHGICIEFTPNPNIKVDI
jgi:hypothetical protein